MPTGQPDWQINSGAGNHIKRGINGNRSKHQAVMSMAGIGVNQDKLPHNIRLIAAVSRLIDLHQSRREGGGVTVPEIPEKAGHNLFLALSIIEALHRIEMDKGIGYCPIKELISSIRKYNPEFSEADIEYGIANLKQGREIHYGMLDENGQPSYGRTWDTTPLVQVQEGFSQIQLTENARLLLRISALRESWLYGDLDADKLVKALERGQYQDIPDICRAMNLDLANKSKQLTGARERPSLAELRSMLIEEGKLIADALIAAAATIGRAIEMVFTQHVNDQFDKWAQQHNPVYGLGNLQADMEHVLQMVETISRQFLVFLEEAQRVRNEGNQPIPFLMIADLLVEQGDAAGIEKTALLMQHLLPWGMAAPFFHPGIFIGQADLKARTTDDKMHKAGYTVDPSKHGHGQRFTEFLARNRHIIIERLRQGPTRFTEIIETAGFDLHPGETPLDFFGVYASPSLLSNNTERIVVGFTDRKAHFSYADQEVLCNDPMMFLEVTHDPN